MKSLKFSYLYVPIIIVAVLSASAVPAIASDTLSVTASSPQTAGSSFSFKVTAVNGGVQDTTYTGTVQFTSATDDQASFAPAQYTFKPTDNGTVTLSATLRTAGAQTITATDTTTSSIQGTSAPITVTPAHASHLALDPQVGSGQAPVMVSFTVRAEDPYGNLDTSNVDTINLTSSDSNANATISGTGVSSTSSPPTVPLVGGQASFTAKFVTAPVQTLAVSDASQGTVSSASALVSVSPGTPDHLAFSYPDLYEATAGVPFHISVQVQDKYNNPETSGSDDVSFSESYQAGNTPPGTDDALTETSGGTTSTPITITDLSQLDSLPGLNNQSSLTLTNGAATCELTFNTTGYVQVTATDTSNSTVKPAQSPVPPALNQNQTNGDNALTVTSQNPLLLSVTPDNASPSSIPSSLILTGTGFVTDSLAYVGGTEQTQGTLNFNSDTKLWTMTTGTSNISDAIGTTDIKVESTIPAINNDSNPETVDSNVEDFIVLNSAIVISSLGPSMVTVAPLDESGTFPLVIEGSNMAGSSTTPVVKVNNTQLSTTDIISSSPSEIDVNVPYSDIGTVGNVPVSVSFDNGDTYTNAPNLKVMQVATLPYTNGGLQMISVPIDYSGISQLSGYPSILGYVDANLDAPSPFNGPVFSYDPTAQSYSQLNSMMPTTVGVGYWTLYNADNLSVVAAGSPATNNMDSSSTIYPLELEPGWNMIGDPYASSVSLANLSFVPLGFTNPFSSSTDKVQPNGQYPQPITVPSNSLSLAAAQSDGLLSSTFYTWANQSGSQVGQGGQYVSTPDLMPYEGAWVYSAMYAWLIVPNPQAGG